MTDKKSPSLSAGHEKERRPQFEDARNVRLRLLPAAIVGAWMAANGLACREADAIDDTVTILEPPHEEPHRPVEDTDSEGLLDDPTNAQVIERLFKQEARITPPSGEYNDEQIALWAARYSGHSPEWDKNQLAYRKRKKMSLTTHRDSIMKGWNRLLSTGELKMVYEVCKREKIPFEVVFLGLTESHWNPNATSRVGARGIWQFMGATAAENGRAWQLIHGVANCWRPEKWRKKKKPAVADCQSDFRGDPERSTVAAIAYLKQLYDQTYNWDKEKNVRRTGYTDSDRWAYAFWSYNYGAGKVRKYYKLFDGKAGPYAEHLKSINRESANYVNTIFGIRAALAELVGGTPLPVEPRLQQEPVDATLSEADIAYEAYRVSEATLQPKAKLEALQHCRSLYEDDMAERRHSRKFVADALDVIDTEMRGIQIDNVDSFERSERIDGSSASVKVDGTSGDMTVDVRRGSEVIEDAVVPYRIVRGDRINNIALRLAGDVNRVGAVKKLIEELNPELRNLNQIRPGDVIRVPAQYVQLPADLNVEQFFATYYPNNPDGRAFFFYLNRKRAGEGFRAREVVIVPVIR